MQLPTPMLRGRLLKRYKRFLADIELENGEIVTAHCPNSGSMKNLIEDNPFVHISQSDNPKRKLRYTLELSQLLHRQHMIDNLEEPIFLELIERGDDLVMAHSVKANTVTVEAIREGVISQLADYETIRTEVPYGTGSRIDILLENAEQKCYVEVKSVTLLEDKTLMFPDAVTTRGQKHLQELINVKRDGHRAVIFFAALHTGGNAFSPADHIDPTYGKMLRDAQDAGVEVLAYQAEITPLQVRLVRELPITL